jgi:hypothetical protein
MRAERVAELDHDQRDNNWTRTRDILERGDDSSQDSIGELVQGLPGLVQTAHKVVRRLVAASDVPEETLGDALIIHVLAMHNCSCDMDLPRVRWRRYRSP